MALTGDVGGPPLAPPTAAATAIDADLRGTGLDAGVLAERAAVLGLRRAGATSGGGATRLVPAADGWLAIALPRPSDVELVPALVGRAVPGDGHWAAVERFAASRAAGEVEAGAAGLGLAVAEVGASAATVTSTGRPRRDHAAAEPPPPLVVDLTSLWAGPLCTHLLGRAGARVVKVEAVGRPDGARAGVAAFHDLLNHGKESVALDLTGPDDRRLLRALVDRADVVVTSARARAVEQLGLDPDAFLDGGADRVWVAITAHGWGSDRVGFGDDAAAAAGLVAWGEDGRPRFAADAVADPLCGALAARTAGEAWRRGGRWFLDVPLAGAARRVAAPGRPVAVPAARRDGRWWGPSGDEVGEPTARVAGGRAAALGADTDRVLRELGL
jgi:hypothetical protein